MSLLATSWCSKRVRGPENQQLISKSLVPRGTKEEKPGKKEA